MKGYSIFDGTMADMAYPQIEAAVKENAIVIFPVGSIEQHGPALPLGVDTYRAYMTAKVAKAYLEEKGVRALIAPPFYWGINNETGSFGGSFHSREETMIAVLWDAMASLKRWGFEKVFFLNHHGCRYHNLAILKAVNQARLDTGIRAYYVMDEGTIKRLGYSGKEPFILAFPSVPSIPSPYVEVHAGGEETSEMWYSFPDLVNLEIWKTLKPTNLTEKELNIWRNGWEEARQVTPQGIFGDPTTASPDFGKFLLEATGQRVADVIEIFLKGRYQPPDFK